MDLKPINDAIAHSFAQTPLAGAGISVTADYDSPQFAESPIPMANIVINIADNGNNTIATDPESVNYVKTALGGLAAFKPFATFETKKPEDIEQEQATRFSELQKLTPNLIPEVYNEYFQQRVKNALQHQQNDGWSEHAASIQRTDTEVAVTFQIPKYVNPDDVEKLAELNKDNILKFLGEYIDRKHPALKGQANHLDMVVETISYDDYKNLKITFRSKEVMEAMKKEGGIAALSAEEHQKLKDTNPLMKLRDGSANTPENPPELQKALARSIFQAAPHLTAKLAKAPDMFAAVSKPLMKLRSQPGTSPEVIEKIDAFLSHDMFKSRELIESAGKKGAFVPTPAAVNRLREHGKVLNVLQACIAVPRDKAPEVLAQLASQTTGIAAAGLAASTPEANVAAAGAAAVCADNEIAVAAAGAGATPDGAIAGAGAACLPKEPVAHAKDKPIGQIGGVPVTERAIETFLDKIGATPKLPADMAHAPRPASLAEREATRTPGSNVQLGA